MALSEKRWDNNPNNTDENFINSSYQCEDYDKPLDFGGYRSRQYGWVEKTRKGKYLASKASNDWQKYDESDERWREVEDLGEYDTLEKARAVVEEKHNDYEYLG